MLYQIQPYVPMSPLSKSDYLDFERDMKSLAALSPFEVSMGANLSSAEGSTRAFGFDIDEDFFPLLGERPAVGRIFNADDHDERRNRALLQGLGCRPTHRIQPWLAIER